MAFIRKFNSPLLLILVFAAIIAGFVGERANATIILTMVFISGVLDFTNTYRSEKAVEKLVKKVTSTATVIRNGKEKEVHLKDIVPGDIVVLSAGDIIPADCKLLDADNFFVNQSALTGEAFPVEKKADDPVLMGTNVVTGRAKAIVEKTGLSTEFGRIAESLETAPPETDFEKNIKNFSYFILRLTFVMVSFVFIANALLGRDLLESFLFAVAIAVGLTPELLPIIMSVSLSRGSIEMSKKEVIVKNLSSIESFGSMDILCTDKTGTLTQNKIALIKYVDGYGNISEGTLLHAYLGGVFHTGVKDFFNNAIREYKKLDIKGYEKVYEIPFDFDRRRESMIVKIEGEHIMITKGAPEDILSISVTDKAMRDKFSDTFASLSRDGFRVLAVAQKEVASGNVIYSKEEEKDMSFLGFVAFLDPPKKDVKDTIEELIALGIEVKILTGDSEILTEKICREIGLKYSNVITGEQLSALSEHEFKKTVLNTTIFSRVHPDQKEKIIIALKKAGKVTGFLGDGINDAPSIKAADVGISVNNAVDVAKETADIILTRKSLRVLKEGVIEGRKTLQNTMKYIMMGLSSNFGNMFSMMGASLLLPFLPMLPSQVLLNNFLYDVSQLSLSTDSVDKESIKSPPHWDMNFIKRFMYVFGPISSIFDFLTFGMLLYVFKLTQGAFQTGWFLESIATQVFVIYMIRTKKLPFLESSPSKLVLLNTLLAVSVAWVIPYTPLGGIFNFGRISSHVLASIAGIVLIYLLLVELAKRIFYSKGIV